MRLLDRNKRRIWYAQYQGREELVEDGLVTGQYNTVYTAPTEIAANVSPARGSTEVRQFGDELDYDRVIVIESPSFVADEYTRWWIDKNPVDSAHDFVTAAVARSLNHVSYAVRRVSANG